MVVESDKNPAELSGPDFIESGAEGVAVAVVSEGDVVQVLRHDGLSLSHAEHELLAEDFGCGLEGRLVPRTVSADPGSEVRAPGLMVMCPSIPWRLM